MIRAVGPGIVGLGFLTLLITSQLLSAQPSTALSQSSSLEDIAEQIQPNTDISGQFTQKKYIQILPQPLISTGRFQLQQSGELNWEVIEPIHSRLIFSRDGISQQVDGQDTQTLISKQTATLVIGKILRAILANDWQTLQQYFTIDVTQSDENWQLQLSPKEAFMQKAIKKISLFGNKQLNEVIIYESNQDRTELSFQPHE